MNEGADHATLRAARQGCVTQIGAGGALYFTLPVLATEPLVTHAFLTHRKCAAAMSAAAHVGARPEPDSRTRGGGAPISEPARSRPDLAAAATAVNLPPEAVVTMRQVHGSAVLRLSKAGEDLARASRQAADALFTTTPGIALAVSTADCVPLLLHDPTCGLIAAVHVGWRGVAAAIIERVVERLGDEAGCDAANLRAGIGPAIGACCYEVGRDVFEAFAAVGVTAAETFLPRSQDRWHLDLAGTVRRLLQRCGLRGAHIGTLPLCTKCHPAYFFSHRRQGERRGAQLSLIALQGRATA